MGHSEYAPNLFLVVHDPFSGKLEISRELLDCGLVAAELAHLIIDGWLEIVDDRVVIAGGGPCSDQVDAFVVQSVARQRNQHTVRIWIETLGEVLHGLIADSLIDQRIIRREQRRGLVRRGPEQFPAVDLLRASGPRLRLDSMLRDPSSFTLAGAVNAALIGAMGIERILETDVDREFFDELARNLPTQLRALMDGVTSAVAAVTLTIRR
jgi:hypothetical protein